MGKQVTIDGIRAVITDPKLGQGGQGFAQKAKLYSNSAIELVIKSQAKAGKNDIRARKLVELNLASHSPYLAGPIATAEKSGQIVHIAPFAKGQDVESDRPRSFPELVELCHHITCQWAILEEQGIAHGDIAPSNVIVSDDGSASLIDFDNFASLEAKVPKATMAGQSMMTAPEIRLRSHPPTIESDRFAYAVLFNMILLRRHPSDGLAANPKELAKVMTTGQWPERVRPVQTGETPVEAMGDILPALFDAAFDIDPINRPTAQQWRHGFRQSLQTIYIHNCGQAFISGNKQTRCPFCQDYIQIPNQASSNETMIFKIRIPSLGTKYSFGLKDGQSIYLGRNNLGRGAASVSNRHLSVSRMNQKLYLRHLGQHPSALYRDGQWYNLKDVWLKPYEYQKDAVLIRLANLDIHLGL